MVGHFNSAPLSILPALRDMYLWAQKQEPVWPQAGVKCSHRVYVSTWERFSDTKATSTKHHLKILTVKNRDYFAVIFSLFSFF